MATARSFAYNSGTGVTGTTQVGSLAVGDTSANYGAGLTWWNGPDESLGYVIGHTSGARTAGNGAINVASPTVGFWRSPSLTDQSFLDTCNLLFNQGFVDGSTAKTWLNTNGYWTSYVSSSNIISQNLFAKLDASNYSSGTWTDETGNGNNATINGATWISTDGGIFDLDGVNDNISIPHTSNLSLSTSAQRTIQVWVKFDTLPSSGQQIPVFGKLSNSYGFDGYWGGLYSNGGVVRCVTNGTSTQKISDSVLTITANTWYLFTFISQITSTANTTKVYINQTQYITTAHGSDSYNESNPLYLGYIGAGVSSTYLNGKIGACYFYTKGLTSDEITTNYNATKSRYGL
jgi:hypothetical protein